MKYQILIFLAFSLILISCVSTSRYQALTSQNEQLQWSKTELKKENDSLKILASELALTKEQLEKTENVLIEFYMKYEGKSPATESIISKSNESQWDTVQSEMNALLKENSILQDKITTYESELAELENQLSNHENKQATIKEKNKSIDLLTKQWDDAKLIQQKLKTESANKDIDINKLKKEVANLKAEHSDIQNLSTQNQFLIDSLHSEIQYLSIKNQSLSLQISDLNEKLEETGKIYREKQNEELIKLQKEITDLNFKQHSLVNENRLLLDSLYMRTNELTTYQQSLEESKLLVTQHKIQLDEKSKKKDNSEQRAQLEKLKSDLTLSEKSLSALNDVIDSKNKNIVSLNKDIANKNEEIAFLTSKLTLSESSQNATLENELAANKEENSKIEKQIQLIESEKETLIKNLNQLKDENEKYNSNNRLLNDELVSKNNQIETLSLKLSEKSTQEENTTQLEPLKDSISSLQNETIRLKHVNKSLESELNRNQNILSIRNTMIDSLKKVILVYNNKIKENTSDEDAVNKLKSDLSKTKNENIKLRARVDSLKVSKTQSQSVSKPKIAGLSAILIQKIKSFTNEYNSVGVTSFIENSGMNIILPQSYVFEGETIAMSQAGSELITKLSSILKPYPNLKLNLTGFGANDANGLKSFENSFRRANTIYKLMSVSGINSNVLKLGSVLDNKHSNQKLPPSGVELTIHAE